MSITRFYLAAAPCPSTRLYWPQRQQTGNRAGAAFRVPGSSGATTSKSSPAAPLGSRLIPARALTDSIEWPLDEDNEPLALSPRGIYHHYCPLALLHRHEERWQVTKDLRRFFDPLPALTALAERIRPPGTNITEVVEVKQDVRPAPNALYEECASEERLEIGDLVSLVPGPHRRIVRSTRDNAALVFGVVSDGREVDRGRYYRVMIYGRTRCKIAERAEAGTLLTVAEIAGCATRTGLAHELFRPGMILGKALESYQPADDDAVGMIMIMVTLQ
ncbi:MAG: hypothetical protein WCD86_10750 [Ktedonobacteraceae bacterium]